MPRYGFFAILAITAMGLVEPVQAGPMPPPSGSAHEIELAASNPPYGYVAFCDRSPEQCRRWEGKATVLSLSEQDWTTLNDVNTRINSRITAVPDQDHYGVKEYWTLPDQAGDCEDFVLLKQRVLIDLGFPPNTVLITIVRDEKGEGHAVLTVTSKEGDFILDNRRAEIRRWNEVRYSFLKRQSSADPDIWVTLAEDQSQPDVASAKIPGNP